MGEAAAAAGISGGADLLGGAVNSIGQARENSRAASAYAQQGKTLNEVIQKYLLPSNTVGLERASAMQASQQSRGLDASLAARGVYNSGEATQAHTQLAAQIGANLANQINQDQYQRAASAAQAYGSDAFGFYDPTKGAVNQGK